MDELAKQLHILREEVEPEWDEARSARLYAGIAQLRRRRQLQRVSLTALTAIGMLAAGAQLMRASQSALQARQERQAHVSHVSHVSQTHAQPAVAAAAPHVLRVSAGQRLWLSDGSLVQVAAGDGVLEVLHDEKMQIDLHLVSGSAHFQVVPNKQRHFVVDADSVKVAVVGTVFDVEHGPDARVHVTVTEGKVRVQSASGDTFVSGGDARWFDGSGHATGPDAQTDNPVAPAPQEADSHAASSATKHRVWHREPGAKASWRSLTQVGEYDEAYRSLAQGADVEDDPAALMDAADAARLSGHPEMAATYLSRVVREHRQSPVAPLAAFTLGRVQLERLGQPSEAAASFATAHDLAPQGSLAQDALAREVEALSKAGNAHEAYLRARAYVQSYPSGRRLHAVRLYGGLE